MKPRLLLDDLKPGEDERKVSWYPEPHVIVHKPDEPGYVEIKGTFRSADCRAAIREPLKMKCVQPVQIYRS